MSEEMGPMIYMESTDCSCTSDMNIFYLKNEEDVYVDKTIYEKEKVFKRKCSKETKEKISMGNKKWYANNEHPRAGIPITKEHKRKISIANKGRKHSKKTRKKMSKALKGKYCGDKSSNWQGGISFDPYPPIFNNKLKEKIRRRDKNICRGCFLSSYRKLEVHHIDYNKQNCNKKNLISLCRSCHALTNFNREYWGKYYQKEILENTENFI